MPRRLVFTTLALLVAGLVPTVQASSPRYSVQIDEPLISLSVRACFGSQAPSALVAFDGAALRSLRDMRIDSSDGSRVLEPLGRRAWLGELDEDDCIEYRVGLEPTPGAGWRSGLRRSGASLLMSPQHWLWLPDTPPSRGSIELEFLHATDINVSAPWDRVSHAPGRTVFRIGPRPYDWRSRIAIGRFPVERIQLPGGDLRLAVLDGSPQPDRAAIRRWIEEAARGLIEVGGRLPVPSAQVLVVPIGHGGEPVPWGQIMRGGGDAVHLYIDQRRPLAEFRADWTLMHELSHLLHPRIDGDDAWLYEGLASYYQNVLRARIGLLDRGEAWAELDAGFERGRRGTPPNRTLAEVSENMPRNGLYMRVYWSGAAVALLADTELRARSGGRQSLDTALAAFAECCMPSDRIWSGAEFMAKLDELSDSDVFMRLYRTHVQSAEFPDLQATYRRLGLSPSLRGLRLLDDAPDAPIRRAIMRPADGRS
ncbi:MAG: hypothetical protein PVG82_04125 [Chromatiales bacterium]